MSFLEDKGKCLVCRLKTVYLNANDRKIYKYVVCKSCKGCIRLPRNKGNIIITCPRCGAISQEQT